MNSLKEEVARAMDPALWSEATDAECDYPAARKRLAEERQHSLDRAQAAIAIVVERAASVAENLTVCMEWWEGHERSVRHPSPVETAKAIRSLLEDER